MIKRLALSAAAFGLLAAPAVQAEEPAEQPAEMTKGEKRLAKMLEGRVAGHQRHPCRLRRGRVNQVSLHLS